MSVDIMKFIEENGFMFVTFPAHTTHILKSLDVSVCGHVKAEPKKRVNEFLQGNERELIRRVVFPIYMKFSRISKHKDLLFY
jgi:hypothetical protein